MKPAQDSFKTLNERVKRILWCLGLRAFSLVLLFIVIELIWGGFIFYKYVSLPEKSEPKIVENITKFDYKSYQNVLEQLQTEVGSFKRSVTD